MGTKTRYLHLAAATAIALSATPGSPSRSAAIERKSSAAKADSSGHSEGHEAGTVSGTVRVIGAQSAASRINIDADPACLSIHPSPMLSDTHVTHAENIPFRRNVHHWMKGNIAVFKNP